MLSAFPISTLCLYFGTIDFHCNEILNYASANIVLSHNLHYYDFFKSAFLSEPLKSIFSERGRKSYLDINEWAEVKLPTATYC